MLYCDTPVPAFAEDICANEEGRIIAVALLRVDHAITTPTSKAQWDAGVADGTVIIIKNVKGSKPKASPITVEGFGRQKTRTVGYDRTAQYMHPDVVGNEDFYNALNFNSSYTWAFYTSGGKIWFPPSDDPVVNIDADYDVPEGLDTTIIWDVAVGWSSQEMHTAYDAPSGVFE